MLHLSFKWWLLIFLLIADVFLWYVAVLEDREGLRVAFLNVGQGDAIYIEAPSGNQILIDAGRDKAALQELSRVMPFYDRSIDVLLATHPDADHIGGIPEILKRYKINAFFHSGNQSGKSLQATLDQQVAAERSQVILARRGTKVWLDESAMLEVLYPDKDVASEETNDASIVAVLRHGKNSFLLTGDAPHFVENYLSALDGSYLDVDVLKAGHHGSKTSTSAYFLQQATPAYTVISAGKDNSYGHPHADVMARLAAAGTQVLQTAEEGTIIFESDGKEIHVK